VYDVLRSKKSPVATFDSHFQTALTFRWEKSIEHLEQAWTDCLGNHNALGCYALQRVIEASDLDEVEHYYLVGEDVSGVVCLVPCFVYRVSLVTVASPRIQRAVQAIQSRFPNFLMLRVFVVGSAISNYGDLLGFKDIDNKRLWSDCRIQSVFDEIRKKAKSLNAPGILVKELDNHIRNRLEPIIGRLFFFADSLPSTCLPIMSGARGGYWESIRSKYRNKIKKRKSIGREKKLSWELSRVSDVCPEKAFELYKQVIDHSAFVFERVNERFFRKIGELFSGHAFYICGYIGDADSKKQISCELVLIDGDAMRLLYSGFDYEVKRDSDVYFNVFYAAIEEAEKLGLKEIHLGQTAYEVKAELGAQRIDLSVAACYLNPLIHWIFTRFKQVFFPKVDFPHRDVFAIPPPKPKTGNPNRVDLPNLVDAPLIADDSAIRLRS